MSEAQSDGTPPYILGSMLTCPVCGFAKNEVMPVDACQFFYECSHCRSRLRPNPGDCCVFCSFGSVKCPPRQRAPEQCCQPKKDRELGGGIHGSAGEMSAMRAPQDRGSDQAGHTHPLLGRHGHWLPSPHPSALAPGPRARLHIYSSSRLR